MPSHEALLKVAKQHKLPAPVLPSPLAPPTQQNVAQAQVLPWEAQLPSGPFDQQQQQQQQQPQLGQLPGGGAACLPVWKPAGPADSHQPAAGAGGPLTASALASEDMLRRVAAEAAYGERWSARKDRVQAASPHGRRPGWDLRCVIVKTGDDCRQELLAMQLIRAFHEIFAEAQLPLWLRPYEVRRGRRLLIGCESLGGWLAAASAVWASLS
jgi:phosphatidylinositol 4-kinase